MQLGLNFELVKRGNGGQKIYWQPANDLKYIVQFEKLHNQLACEFRLMKDMKIQRRSKHCKVNQIE